MKLCWRVQPAPTGPYRSFERRGWPTAWYDDEYGPAAASIYCEDEYIPRRVKNSEHAPLRVQIACWIDRDGSGTKKAFDWRTMKQEFATLKDAKEGAEAFLKDHPEFYPEGVK